MSVYDERPWLRSYDAGVAPDIDVPDGTYVDLLERGLNFQPRRAAFYFLGRKFTYQDLNTLSMRFASFLREMGCVPGDVVGINLPNTPQYLIAMAGTFRAGCVVSGVSPLLTPKEMAYQLNDLKAKVLVTLDAIYENRVQKIRDDVPALKCIVATNIADFMPPLKSILAKLLKKVPMGKVDPIPGKVVVDFKRVVSEARPSLPKASIGPGDTCLIQYTGGTTGTPKGAILTHRNMMANITQCIRWLHLEQASDTYCSGFPFFHAAGLFFGMVSMATSNTQCLIPDPRNTKHMCGEMSKYPPHIMLHVPSLYQMLVNDPAFSKIDFSLCEVCISGAAPFSAEGIASLEAIVGKGKLLELYGMTEASPIISMNPMKGKKKIGSVGIPMPGTRIKLVDVETGTKEVALGEVGEVIVRGPQVMKEYHGKPEDTAHTLREFENEKWLYTGDVARMDEDGYFYIADRTKDMLIVGGFKVFSREVEEALSQHKAVEFCAVIGISNPERPDSQIVKAVIQLSKEAAGREQEDIKKEIMEYCRENLSPYKVPKIIEITEAIPLTAVGKVDKKALRV